MEKFIGLLFIVPSAMLATVSAMAAQNIGAKKPERARKTMKYSIAIAVGFGTVASVILQFIPEYAVRIFTSDSSVITLGGLSAGVGVNLGIEDKDVNFYAVIRGNGIM